MRWRFDGWIAGLGTAEGTRIVVGHWPRSPLGAFSDVMVERADGHRVLLAPSDEVAAFVGDTYLFDEARVVPVMIGTGGRWQVDAGPLRMSFTTGPRGPIGLLLRAVPPPLARTPAWISLIDRPARLVMPGVRTRGSAGNGRREWYGAQDLRPITEVSAAWDGTDLGPLSRVTPPVRFGFGSVPPLPALVRVTTTVAV
ncbi:hypothetical protein ACIA8K_36725 [Catenuloplanes sp. NPDC051500]|uniref:hypothetical protein n=1 Tax=Catenuloplanes sp. NPDC051500 TaxID=3363959 RepID=UPI0037A9870B